MGFEPKFDITAETLRFVAEATELRAWIATAVVDVPWLPALQRDTAARLAHSSTSIEGNPFTLPEVEALARGEIIGGERRATVEVLNALGAMRWIWKQKKKNKIEEKDLLHLHRRLTLGLLPEKEVGVFKSIPNRVIDSRGNPIYIPPRPEDASRLTREFLSWLNGDAGRRLHAVIAAAIAHHQCSSSRHSLAQRSVSTSWIKASMPLLSMMTSQSRR
jgi:Fic family protein